jgi:hypothetical protein
MVINLKAAKALGTTVQQSLLRAPTKTGRLCYREINARLKDAGYCNERGVHSTRSRFEQ